MKHVHITYIINLNRATHTYHFPRGLKSLHQRASLDFENIHLRRSMSINGLQKHRFTKTHTQAHTHAHTHIIHTHTHTHTHTHIHSYKNNNKEYYRIL